MNMSNANSQWVGDMLKLKFPQLDIRDVQCTCIACPTQYYGKIGEYVFYYRSRWDEWHCAIAPTIDAAVMPDTTASIAIKYGTDDKFGWVEPTEVLDCIVETIELYLQMSQVGNQNEVN